MKIVRVGTRGSALALAQTSGILDALRALHPNVEFETVVVKTTGDIRADLPFAAIGTKGMFVKEIEEALLDGSIDLAVHSLKDMPTELPTVREIATVRNATPSVTRPPQMRRVSESRPSSSVPSQFGLPGGWNVTSRSMVCGRKCVSRAENSGAAIAISAKTRIRMPAASPTRFARMRSHDSFQ